VRARGIAYVFQGGNLLPTFNAAENVAFAVRVAESDAVPEEMLELVGLTAKAEHLPAELSGGEMQRVALARALAQRPELLLCDEPTGHLDSDTGERVLVLLERLQETFGFELVLATHDPVVASRLGGIVDIIEDGISGLLVPAGEEQPLAAAMQRLVDDGALRTNLGNAARQRVERFAASSVLPQFETLYRELLSQGRTAGVDPGGELDGVGSL